MHLGMTPLNAWTYRFVYNRFCSELEGRASSTPLQPPNKVSSHSFLINIIARYVCVCHFLFRYWVNGEHYSRLSCLVSLVKSSILFNTGRSFSKIDMFSRWDADTWRLIWRRLRLDVINFTSCLFESSKFRKRIKNGSPPHHKKKARKMILH